MGKVDVIYESRRKAKEARLEIVAELYAKGKSYSKIRTEVMERLGLETYSKATVEKDVKTLLKEWREARLEDTDEAVTLFLERNRQHYEEAREEWERSREKASLVSVKEKGLTIVATRLFIAENGYAKLNIALARGKREFDKRETIKEKDMRRNEERD